MLQSAVPARYHIISPNIRQCSSPIQKSSFFLADDYPHLRQQHFLRSEEDYLRLFSGADDSQHSIVGEGSTNYLRSATAVSNALELNPNAKFIVMLRNPINVAHAFHMEQLFARNEDVKSFEEAWSLQTARKNGLAIPNSCRAPECVLYGEIALFSQQIERFFHLVPPSQRLVLLQEDLLCDTLGVYKQTLEFLELDYDDRVVFPVVNGSHSHRSEFIAHLILSPPHVLEGPIFYLRGLLRRRKPRSAEWIKSLLKKDTVREELSDIFKNELMDYFRSDIDITEEIIGRNLSNWKKI